MMPDVRAMVLNLPTIRAIQARTEFEVAARWTMRVDFGDPESHARFREAHEWCSSECRGRWRVEPARLIGESAFCFETVRDAVLFRLRFDDLVEAPV